MIILFLPFCFETVKTHETIWESEKLTLEIMPEFKWDWISLLKSLFFNFEVLFITGECIKSDLSSWILYPNFIICQMNEIFLILLQLS